MATFWVTERRNIQVDESEETSWQERVENLSDVEVLFYGEKRMKVRTGDEISLRMVCGDVCTVERTN